MQCWRFIRYVTVALVLLGAPAWLPAQEATKKNTALNPTAAAATATQPPAQNAAKKATTPGDPAPKADPAARVVAPPNTSAPKAQKEFKFFAFLSDSAYTSVEQISLWVVLAIAVAGLLYAVMLAGQVYGADEGTEKMREVGAALRQGA